MYVLQAAIIKTGHLKKGHGPLNYHTCNIMYKSESETKS